MAHRTMPILYLNLCEFINDFSDHYLKIRQTGQSLPQDTLAYLLLSNCNLNVEKIQLVMATLVSKNSASITYQAMKDTLNTIFASEALAKKLPQQNNQVSAESDILMSKSDTIEQNDNSKLLANRGSDYGRNNPNYRGRSTSGRRGFKFRHRSASSRGRVNPLSDQGVPLGCLRCKSIFHFVKDCREENRGNNNGGYGGYRGNSNRHDRNKERNGSFRDHEVNFSYLFVGCASSEED